MQRYLDGLRARFDRLVLLPPASRGDTRSLTPHDAAVWPALQAWCHLAAGPGNSAWSQPGAQPAVALRLAVAALRAADDLGAAAWANALARELDGSQRLAALPGASARLALRLGVKARDAMWWRARQAGDPWDAGWAIDTAPALGHWRTRFMPRRATLILADRQQFEALRAVLAALVARSDDFRHPVRWLWVGGDSDVAPAHGLAVARFVLA